MGISAQKPVKILESHGVIDEKPLKNDAKNTSEFEQTTVKELFETLGKT